MIHFYDEDGIMIHSYYGPNTVQLIDVYPFYSFEIADSDEENIEYDVAHFMLTGDYYGSIMTFGYGNYDCGQIGNMENYVELSISEDVEIRLYADCLGTEITHQYEGPRTIDIHDHHGQGESINDIDPWKAMEIRRKEGSIHYPLGGFIITGEYYGFKRGLHQCPYFPEKYHNVEVTLPLDLEIVF